ncbi:MAG: hypothetical protein GKR90_26100 [Pseudomonadales bacterium]|nr:hypothetical protein [Pseudomonadales bacterium]
MLREHIGRFIAALRSRKLVEMSVIRDDLRKFGFVLAGAGILAISLNANWLGVVPVMLGLIFLFFGLTLPKDESDDEIEPDE